MAKKITPKVTKINILKENLIINLEKSLGVVTSACRASGCDRGTFYKYYNADAKFRAKCDDIKNVALDFVESQLYKQIKNDNVTAAIFYLKTKGKDRGYIERVEQDVRTREGSFDLPVVDFFKTDDKEKKK